MGKALIIGAGAIGRGFLPWTFKDLSFDLYDNSLRLCEGIGNHGGYSSYISRNDQLVGHFFRPNICTSAITDLPLNRYDVAFVAVGPRNCFNLPVEFSALTCPIFSLENDPDSVKVISKIFKSDKVFFGVPDVITSSTASATNLLQDPFALHTEEGTLYLEDNAGHPYSLREHLPDVVWATKQEMIREWDAKLFLHNTPHCVAAYLGFLNGDEFLHQSFENPFIVRVVEGVIEELILALKRTSDHDHTFLESYADKELKRFSNPHLCDPISRVAREPLRKLAKGGRLTGALTMCLTAGVNPVYLNLGISAALNYLDSTDKDFQAMSAVNQVGVSNFLRYFLQIPSSSVESLFISNAYSDTLEFLKGSLK